MKINAQKIREFDSKVAELWIDLFGGAPPTQLESIATHPDVAAAAEDAPAKAPNDPTADPAYDQPGTHKNGMTLNADYSVTLDFFKERATQNALFKPAAGIAPDQVDGWLIDDALKTFNLPPEVIGPAGIYAKGRAIAFESLRANANENSVMSRQSLGLITGTRVLAFPYAADGSTVHLADLPAWANGCDTVYADLKKSNYPGAEGRAYPYVNPTGNPAFDPRNQ